MKVPEWVYDLIGCAATAAIIGLVIFMGCFL
jgi:hypothetical protein